MRLIVAGWRDLPLTPENQQLVRRQVVRVVHSWHDEHDHPKIKWERVTIVDGACHLGGVDLLAHRAALELGCTTERHPARNHPTQDFGGWPACGPRRNEHMASLGADYGLLLPHVFKHRGTLDMAGALIRHGISFDVRPLPGA